MKKNFTLLVILKLNFILNRFNKQIGLLQQDGCDRDITQLMQAFEIEYQNIDNLYEEMLRGQVADKRTSPDLNIAESLQIFISKVENIVDSDLQTLENFIQNTTQ